MTMARVQEAVELEVLEWLLAEPAIAVAVDQACSGGGAEARALFERALEELLAQAANVPSRSGTATSAADRSCCEPAQKRLRPAPAHPVALGDAGVMGAAPRQLAETQRLPEADLLHTEVHSGSPVPSDAAPLYWKIDLPGVSKVLAQRGILPEHHVPVEHPHATLLYLGGAHDDKEAAVWSGISVDELCAMRKALEAVRGKAVEIKMTEVVVDKNVACAKLSLPPEVPCANAVPHVTFGTRFGVPARYSNTVLENLKAGLSDGVTTLTLPMPKTLKGTVTLQCASPDEPRAAKF